MKNKIKNKILKIYITFLIKGYLYNICYVGLLLVYLTCINPSTAYCVEDEKAVIYSVAKIAVVVGTLLGSTYGLYKLYGWYSRPPTDPDAILKNASVSYEEGPNYVYIHTNPASPNVLLTNREAPLEITNGDAGFVVPPQAPQSPQAVPALEFHQQAPQSPQAAPALEFHQQAPQSPQAAPALEFHQILDNIPFNVELLNITNYQEFGNLVNHHITTMGSTVADLCAELDFNNMQLIYTHLNGHWGEVAQIIGAINLTFFMSKMIIGLIPEIKDTVECDVYVDQMGILLEEVLYVFDKAAPETFPILAVQWQNLYSNLQIHQTHFEELGITIKTVFALVYEFARDNHQFVIFPDYMF